jgi:hypothetical protein
MAGVILTTNGSPWLLTEPQTLTCPPVVSPTDREGIGPCRSAAGMRRSRRSSEQELPAALRSGPMDEWLRLAYIYVGAVPVK